jgi:hypothetical protein
MNRPPVYKIVTTSATKRININLPNQQYQSTSINLHASTLTPVFNKFNLITQSNNIRPIINVISPITSMINNSDDCFAPPATKRYKKSIFCPSCGMNDHLRSTNAKCPNYKGNNNRATHAERKTYNALNQPHIISRKTRINQVLPQIQIQIPRTKPRNISQILKEIAQNEPTEQNEQFKQLNKNEFSFYV